jgi:Ca-activated chloride channel homolog
METMGHRAPAFIVVGALLATAITLKAQSQDGFRFKSGVELVNVTASVTDRDGRFVSGLRKDDFTVFDNGEQQEITQFSNERVPVSLGILLDSSGSMASSDKMAYARDAIDRFINELLDKDDELFFVDFATRAHLDQDWTTDRRAITRAVSRVAPNGGTAMYDAIADALPIAASGRHQKKALLVISDGNDTDSRMSVSELRQAIRESEVLVYALGVDGSETIDNRIITQPPIIRPPIPIPFPIPGGRPRGRFPQIIGGGPIRGGGRNYPRGGERVNPDALRQITDDTGGRTEIVRGFGDLDAATARIADELSKQYYLGYARTGEKDGRWHAIRLEVRDRRLNVRARRGYVAS